MKSISHVIKGKLKTQRFFFFFSSFFLYFRFLDLEKFDLDIFIYDLSAIRNNV